MKSHIPVNAPKVSMQDRIGMLKTRSLVSRGSATVRSGTSFARTAGNSQARRAVNATFAQWGEDSQSAPSCCSFQTRRVDASLRASKQG